MPLAIPAQKQLTRNALTVELNCANRTRKHAASATAFSVHPAYPSIQRSTPRLHQPTTGKFGNERGPKTCRNCCTEHNGRWVKIDEEESMFTLDQLVQEVVYPEK